MAKLKVPEIYLGQDWYLKYLSAANNNRNSSKFTVL